MFWINKTINKWFTENIEPSFKKTYIDLSNLEQSATSHEKKLNEQDKRLNCHADEIDKINNKINAIIECLNGDRKDINVLITMVKTLKTAKKGRK